jgi:rubrerythrin
MNVFAFAIEREREREQYYDKLSEKSGDQGLKQIYSLLAKQEAKHAGVVERLRSETRMELGYESFLLDVKALVHELNSRDGGQKVCSSEAAALEEARDFELDSIKLYKEALASDTTPPPARDALERLLKEEQLHFKILDSLAEFVARPEQGHWLENAEWYHQDDY